MIAFLGILLGTAAAPRLGVVSVPPAAALTAAGTALGGGPGTFLAAAGLGLLSAAGRWVLPRRVAADPVAGRLTAVQGSVVGRWRYDGESWTAPLATRLYRQHRRVEPWPETVWLSVRGEEPPPRSRRLRARGILRRSPGYANAPGASAGGWRLSVRSARFVEPVGGRGGRRASPAAATPPAIPTRGGALARALVLGDAGALPAAWLRALRRAGLAHLVAVSGLHVGLVLAGAGLLVARLPGRALRLTGLLAALLAYAAVVGPRPSLLRAAAMAALVLGALAAGRPPKIGSVLALAGAGLLLAEPRLVVRLGFQLTVAATAAIVLLSAALAERLPAPVAVSVAAQAGTLPLTLPHFHLLSWGAALVHLVALPWTALCLGCSLLAFAAAWATGAGELPGAAVLDVLATPLAWLAALPPALSPTVPAAIGPAGGLLLAATVVVVARGGRRRALLAALLVLDGQAPPAAREVEAALIDVGQGDALLLRDGDRALLIDGGGWRRGDLGGRVLVPALAELGVFRLRAVVLTHPDRDHCGGLVEVASYLPVAEVWTPPGWGGEACAAELLGLPGARLRPIWAGMERRLGAWRLTALHPAPGERGGRNARSLVLLAAARGRRLLLTGDLDAGAERRLLARWPAAEVRADVLKVAHHGSASSTSLPFLARVRPSLALISAGVGNPYGHPSERLLERLRERAVPVLRTDRDGAIRLRWREGSPLAIELPGAPRPLAAP